MSLAYSVYLNSLADTVVEEMWVEASQTVLVRQASPVEVSFYHVASSKLLYNKNVHAFEQHYIEITHHTSSHVTHKHYYQD